MLYPSRPPSTSGPSECLPPIRRLSPLTPSTRLKDSICVITGCSSALGIGRATAHAFALASARAIYICDLISANLSALQAELLALDGRAGDLKIHTRVFDAADSASVKSVVDDVLQQYGRIDVFFANAGVVGTHKPLQKISDEEFMKTLKTNILSVFLAIKHAGPAMSPSGSIIATASVAGLRSNAGSSDYSASKAAVLSLVQTSAFQLAGKGLRVNAILPGLIETGMTGQIFEAARARGRDGRIGQLNPLQRGGSADEVARVAVFLASAEATYVNGQGWAVDGGLSAGLPFVRGKLA